MIKVVDMKSIVSVHKFTILCVVTVILSSPLVGATGEVALYHLDDNANDASGNGNHGTVYGGASWTSGQCNSALDFDGSNDYIQVPDSSSMDVTGSLSILAWIKKTDQSTTDVMANKKFAYDFATKTDGKLRVYIGTGSGWGSGFSGNTDVVDGNWHHVAFTYDDVNNELITYVDEVEDGSTIYTDSLGASTYDLYIGRDPGASRFNGRIDEVRIYNRVLSQSEVQAEMGCDGGMTTISCTGSSVHDCRGSSASVSSIDLVSAPSAAGAGDSITVRVDWTGWHWNDDNHFAFFMKPTSGGSWQYIDSCKTYQADSETNYYTMDCPITIPSDYNGEYYIRVTANDYQGYCEPGEAYADAEGETVITISISRTFISCTGETTHFCTDYHDSISSIDLISAPPEADAEDTITLQVDWDGWHYTDDNIFAFFMKPVSGSSWEYVDSCTTYQDDSGTNYYTMDCLVTIPSDYAGDYYIKVTANGYGGYCEPGETGIDAESDGSTIITITGVLTAGETVSGNGNTYYKYTADPATPVYITLTMGGSDDYDLYVKWDGSVPGPDNWDCRPLYDVGTTEVCRSESISGTIHIYVDEYYSLEGFQIRVDQGGKMCIDKLWSPKYWTSANELYRTSDHVAYRQSFKWDTEHLNALIESDRTSYEYEIRRPYTPDVWDALWYEFPTCYMAYTSNIPNDDPWVTEESDLGLCELCSEFPAISCDEEFATVTRYSEHAPPFDTAHWYYVEVQFIRKDPDWTIDMQTESEAGKITWPPTWTCKMTVEKETS